jgi:hypothetical protein
LDLNSEHGNMNQEGRGSNGGQYVAVATCREAQHLFEDGATIAIVSCGGSISDSLSYARAHSE